MGYKEIKKFRDGTVMVEIDGVMSIIGHEANEQIKNHGFQLKDTNYGEAVADRLQKKFPHMTIEYVDMPGIFISSADASIDNRKFYGYNKTDSQETIYKEAFTVVATIEQKAIAEDLGYFIKHYTKTK